MCMWGGGTNYYIIMYSTGCKWQRWMLKPDNYILMKMIVSAEEGQS